MNKTYFADKTIWITGASSGIGEALALALAAEGARLVLSSRDKAAVRRVEEQCRLSGAAEGTFSEVFDLEMHASFPLVVRKILDRVGNIDLLINNAGVGQRATALSCKPEVVRRIMEINFFGPVFLTQDILPSMISRKSGRIVIVSSVLGKYHLPGRSAYAASKHALRGYFDTLRTELHTSGVGVTIAYPGWIATNISRNALTADGAAYAKATRVGARKMNAKACSRHILDAVAAGRNEVTMGGFETWGGLLRILLPKLYERVIRRRGGEFIAA